MLTIEKKKRIDQEWRTHRHLLLFVAKWKCGGHTELGKELLMKAILAVIEEGRLAWDPEKYSFVTHLRFVMFDIQHSEGQLMENNVVEPLVKAARVAAAGMNPEEELRGKRMFETLVAECPADSDERRLAECAASGIHDIKQQSEALGIDVDSVYRARERLRVIIDRLLKRHNLKLVTP